MSKYSIVKKLYKLQHLQTLQAYQLQYSIVKKLYKLQPGKPRNVFIGQYSIVKKLYKLQRRSDLLKDKQKYSIVKKLYKLQRRRGGLFSRPKNSIDPKICKVPPVAFRQRQKRRQITACNASDNQSLTLPDAAGTPHIFSRLSCRFCCPVSRIPGDRNDVAFRQKNEEQKKFFKKVSHA